MYVYGLSMLFFFVIVIRAGSSRSKIICNAIAIKFCRFDEMCGVVNVERYPAWRTVGRPKKRREKKSGKRGGKIKKKTVRWTATSTAIAVTTAHHSHTAGCRKFVCIFFFTVLCFFSPCLPWPWTVQQSTAVVEPTVFFFATKSYVSASA